MGFFEQIAVIITRYYPYFLEGVKNTLIIAAMSVVLGVVFGTLMAIMRMCRIKPLKWIAMAYIEFVRGTPLMVQLMFIFYGLPMVGIEFPDVSWIPNFSRFMAGIVAMSMNSCAYVAEVIRSGIQAVDEGQMEAARSIGFKYGELPANVYGYAFAKGSENSYVYEFDAQSFYNSNKLLINYHILTTPEGVDENSCFASGCAYNGILFYTSGNKVYRLDFSQKGGSVSVIYTHPKGTITSMEFAKAGKSTPAATYPEYIYNPNQELGIAIDNGDGTSDFVILDLNTAGSVDESHIFERTFGTIKDIAYI